MSVQHEYWCSANTGQLACNCKAERIAALEAQLAAAEQANKDYVANAAHEITVRDDRIAALKEQIEDFHHQTDVMYENHAAEVADLRAENERLNEKMPCGLHRRVDAETPEGGCGACLVLRHEEELSACVERLEYRDNLIHAMLEAFADKLDCNMITAQLAVELRQRYRECQEQALAAQGDHPIRREAQASRYPQPHREDEAAQGEER